MKTEQGDSVLSVTNISVDIGTTKILQHVSFSACNGDILAVMGPTGSGKTTLLNTIAGRQSLTDGNIFLSGKPFDKRRRRQLGFVIQHDVFFSNLTLWETLYFTAMIRLPESQPMTDKLKRLEDIIDLLQLRKCGKTVIGDIFNKGLSGGEKKRTSIAMTLLTDPEILLLDEPTSGLDSNMALQIVKQLKRLANEYNKTIIVTIHQPSSQIYHMFDSLLLLGKGKVVYHGCAHRDPLNFLEQFGYVCDPLYNPADFFMDVLTTDDTKLEELVEGRKNLADETTDERIKESYPSNILTAVRYSSNSLVSITTTNDDAVTSNIERWPTGFAMQFRMLTWRSFRQSRSTFLYLYHIILYTALGILVGLTLSNDVTVFRDIMGMMFFVTAVMTYGSGIQAVATFPADIEIISLERASGAYRLSAFYLSKMASELPMIFFIPTLFITGSYWIAGYSKAVEFFLTWSILMLGIVNIQGTGILISIVIPDRKFALTVVQGLLHFSLLFCGFVIQNVPSWLVWAKYFSNLHYPISALCIVLYQKTDPVSCNATTVEKISKCLQNSSDYVTSVDVLHDAGIDLPVYCYVGMMLLICVAVRVAVYIALRLKRPQVT